MKAAGTEEAKVIDNSAIRFSKCVELQTIPKQGDVLEMSAGRSAFPCEVLQVNWHESKNTFVVACKYGRSRMLPEDYFEISGASEWTSKPLL